MCDELKTIRDRIINSIPVKKLYLFGSYANGTSNENSDFDFYIVIPNNGMRPIDAINAAYMAMRGLKRRPVDIMASTEEMFDKRSERATLERKIAREGVLVYEYEQ